MSRTEPRLLYLCLETLDPDRAAATHVHGLAGGLARLGWRVDLVGEASPRAGALASLAMRYLRLNLRAILALGRADAVYVRAHFAALPLALAARLARRPIFHEINGSVEDIAVTYPAMARATGFLRRLYAFQFARATKLFAVTEGLARWGAGLAGHTRAGLAPNGVDCDRFTPPADGAREEAAIFYGDLARWHGLELMLAAARSPNWPASIRLVLIGRGSAGAPDVPADLAGRVEWLDRLPQAELALRVGRARVGLAPITDPSGRSASGVMPLKLLEMMACATPVVVTDLPGQADIVRAAGCGRVIGRADAAALASAVAEIAAAPEAAEMGARGRAFARKNHSWDAIAAIVDADLRAAIR